MGKTSKSTKSKHQDFQKVKLKAGRKVPKSLNDTNTAFKSASVIIKSQLKGDSTSEGSGKSKHSFKELMSQCKHHNATVRLEAFNGLRSLVDDNEEVICTHLAAIIESSSESCIDREATVRKSGLKLFKNIIDNLSAVQIYPFFNLISAHLNCAMTHIDENIQFDSLKMLDLCLESFPELVICSHSKLMPNFMEQISSKSNHGGKRSLLICPGSHLSTQKWRVKVLNRLYNFLLAIITHYKEILSKNQVDDKEKMNQFIWSDKEVTTACIYGSASVFNCHSSNSINQMSSSIISDSTKLKEYIEQLFPLLLQIWIEAGPTSLKHELPDKDDEEVSTMHSVLRVICLIMECVNMTNNSIMMIKWIKDTYLKKSLHYFVPTLLDIDCDEKQSGKNGNSVSSCTINLMKCDFLRNFIHSDVIESSNWYVLINRCIQSVLSYKNRKIQTNELHIILRVLRKILNVETRQDIIKDVLDALFSYHSNLPSSSSHKMILIKFICIILAEDGVMHLNNFNSLKNFMKQLPEFLNQTMDNGKPEAINKLIKNMCRLCSQQHESLLDELQNKSSLYFNSSKYSQISSWTSFQQKSLIELLFWVPHWQKECFTEICLLNYHNIIKFDALKYLLEILAFKYNQDLQKNDEGYTLDHGIWMSFLFSLIIGCPQDEMRNSEKFELILDANLFMGWELKFKKISMICDILKQTINSDEVAFLYEAYILKLLDFKKKLPLSSAIGVLICLFSTHEKISLNQSKKKVHCYITNKDFCNKLLDFIKDLFLILSDVKSDDHQEVLSSIIDVTLATSAEVIGQLFGTMKSFMTLMMSFLEGEIDYKMQCLVSILTKFISFPFVRPMINKSLLCMEISRIEVTNGDVLENQWWSNFKYAVSLL